MLALDFFEEFQSWSHGNVDYLDPKYNAHGCIAQMHALCTMLLGAQRKYIDKPWLRAILLEALKSCVWYSGCDVRCVILSRRCIPAVPPCHVCGAESVDPHESSCHSCHVGLCKRTRLQTADYRLQRFGRWPYKLDSL